MNYLDDIIVFGNTPEETVNTFVDVIGKLDAAGFRISIGKLSMFKDKLKLLGIVLTREGISPDPIKIKAIVEFPEPTTIKEVQRFLGIANYLSDFIKAYSLISAPLYKLSSGPNENFKMNDEERTSFLKIKELIVKPVILAFVDSDKEIYLEVDASINGYGGFAYQVETFTEEDLPQLKLQMQSILQKDNNELTQEMNKAIDDYIAGEEVQFDPNLKPSSGSQTSEELFPYLNTQARPRKKDGIWYVPRVNFFFSKKFTKDQIRIWSSLMKELFAIVDILERRQDFLGLAKRTLVLTDCSACVFLYKQSKSNSLMARYLARLQAHRFEVIIKHKSGKHMIVADALSRTYVLDKSEHYKGKLDHNKGVLIKHPFLPGQVISPGDIIDLINQEDDQIIQATDDPCIAKGCQTDLLMKDVVNSVNDTKYRISRDLNQYITHDILAKQQREEFSKEYDELLTGKPQRIQSRELKIVNGIILIEDKGKFVRLIPTKMRNLVLSRAHLLGHYSYKKLRTVIGRTDYWPTITKDCERFTRHCLSCNWIRPKQIGQYPLGYPIAGAPGQVWMVDVVSGLGNSEGHHYFLSAIDTFSRFTVTFPLREDKSEEIIKKLRTHVFSVFGYPEILVTDGARNLNKSQAFTHYCRLHNISQVVKTPYSSRSLGLCERVHRSILNNIRSISDSFSCSWTDSLSLGTQIYNAIPHQATNHSPYEVMFNRASELFNPLPALANLESSDTGLNDYIDGQQQKLRDIYEDARKYDEKYKKDMRNRCKGKVVDYKYGQFVLALDKRPPGKNEKIKLRPKWYGPFKVLQNYTTAIEAENTLTGTTGCLNKNLIKLMEEKDIKFFNELPYSLKRIFGNGFTNKEWADLHEEGRLHEHLKNYNDSGIQYGLETPADRLLTIANPDEQTWIPLHQKEDSDSSDSSDVEGKDKLDQPPTQTTKRVTFALPPTKHVTFAPNLLSRPKRQTKAVVRLNL